MVNIEVETEAGNESAVDNFLAKIHQTALAFKDTPSRIFDTPKSASHAILQIETAIDSIASDEDMQLRIYSDASPDLVDLATLQSSNLREGKGFTIENGKANFTKIPTLWNTPDTVLRALHARLEQKNLTGLLYKGPEALEDPTKFSLPLTDRLSLVIDTSARPKIFGGSNLKKHGGEIKVSLVINDSDGMLEQRKEKILKKQERRHLERKLKQKRIQHFINVYDPNATGDSFEYDTVELQHNTIKQILHTLKHQYRFKPSEIKGGQQYELHPKGTNDYFVRATFGETTKTLALSVIVPPESKASRIKHMKEEIKTILIDQLALHLPRASREDPLYFFYSTTDQLVPTVSLKRFIGIKDISYPTAIVWEVSDSLIKPPQKLIKHMKKLSALDALPEKFPQYYTRMVIHNKSYKVRWSLVKNGNGKREDDPELSIICWTRKPKPSRSSA